MTSFGFTCIGVRAQRHALAPTLLFDVRIEEATGAAVQAVMLRCQIRLEPQRRPYSDAEAAGLTDLFGERWRWGDTQKPIQFAATSAMVPAFTGSIEVSLPVVCSYDVEVVTAKYMHALRDGAVPLLLLFSGTVFLHGPSGLAVEQVPWDLEAPALLPVATWREMIGLHFPDTGYLRLTSRTLGALSRFKARQALPSWEETFALLLDKAGEVDEP